jgi:hypothetical protein
MTSNHRASAASAETPCATARAQNSACISAPGEHPGRIVRLAASCRQAPHRARDRWLRCRGRWSSGHTSTPHSRQLRYTKVAPGGINPNRHQPDTSSACACHQAGAGSLCGASPRRSKRSSTDRRTACKTSWRTLLMTELTAERALPKNRTVI